jgi:hypothetical protein
MRSKLHCLLLAGAIALAQPVLHAAADDQVVPTRQEAHHVGKLENGTVRIVDVEIVPGDQTLFHEHAIDYAFVMIHDASLSNEVWGTPPKDITIRSGDVGYYRSAQGAYIHRFSNVGQTKFRAIGIELLAPLVPKAPLDPLPPASGYVPVMDNERVRGYRLVLEPGEELQAATLNGPSVRVIVSGGPVEQRLASGPWEAIELRPAAFEFRDETTVVALKNIGATRVEIVEFEIK